mgnify:CR=1 FL=1
MRNALICVLLCVLVQLFFKYENVYRFWSASLLIMYDAVEANPKVSVRMVDFAHVATVEEVENPQLSLSPRPGFFPLLSHHRLWGCCDMVSNPLKVPPRCSQSGCGWLHLWDGESDLLL